MLPATVTRVPEHTAAFANEQIALRTARAVAESAAGGPAALNRRIAEVEQEWDIERALQANFATVSLAGLTLGLLVDRKWWLFTAAAAGFMVQHALQGWCPPAVVMRRLGFRTVSEIEQERMALKALRGDLAAVGATPDWRPTASEAIAAVER